MKLNSGRTEGVTKAHTLVRVRNNQRRHRERRRQYVTALEQKIQETERRLAESKTEIEARLNNLESKETSCSAISRDVPEYSQRRESLTEDVPRPSDKPFGISHALHPNSEDGQTGQATAATARVLSAEPSFSILTSPASFTDCPSMKSSRQPAQDHPKPGLMQSPTSRCSTKDTEFTISEAWNKTVLDDSFCKNAKIHPPSDGPHELASSGSTMLCRQAFTLVRQHNPRQLDVDDIKRWLEPGFRCGSSQAEGCRVDNLRVYGLLDFISEA